MKIVSGLKIEENNNDKTDSISIKDNVKISVEHATGEKCDRCWMYDDDIEDGLCPRCRKILEK